MKNLHNYHLLIRVGIKVVYLAICFQADFSTNGN